MKFRWTIFYVKDVPKAIAFYSRAFGLEQRMIAPGDSYAELESGDTLLAFASMEMARDNVPEGVIAHDPSGQPLAVEIGIMTSDVQAGYERAVEAGATPISAPVKKPWGQTVAYVRDPDGILIEVASEI